MRYYSSTAGQMTLSGDITAGDGTFQVNTVTGLPVSFPYTLVLDPGETSEEIVSVTSSSGTTLTVTRAQDGTSAQSHSIGAIVRHMMTARDLREPQEHIDASAGVHGLTGALVGLTDTQTLTNKTINGASNTLSGIPSSAVTGLDTHTAATAAHGATGAVVGTTNTQTLTNKTISGANNTFAAIPQSAVSSLTTDISALQSADTSLDSRLDTVEAAWAAYTPVVAGTGWALGNGTISGRYKKVGETVHFRIKMVFGSTTSKGTGSTQLTLGLPTAAHASINVQCRGSALDASPVGRYALDGLILQGASEISMFSDSFAVGLNETNPIVWATGDEIYINGVYEEA